MSEKAFMLRDWLDASEDVAEHLLADITRDKLDAARYRWVRESSCRILSISESKFDDVVDWDIAQRAAVGDAKQ